MQTAFLVFAWRGATQFYNYSSLFLRVIMTGKYPKTAAFLPLQLFSSSDCVVAAQLNWREMSDIAYHDVSTVTRLPRLWASDFSCWGSASSYRSQAGVSNGKPAGGACAVMRTLSIVLYLKGLSFQRLELYILTRRSSIILRGCVECNPIEFRALRGVPTETMQWQISVN